MSRGSNGFFSKATVTPLKGQPNEYYNFTMTVDPSKIQGDSFDLYIRVRDYLKESRALHLVAEQVFNETPVRLNATSYYRNLMLPGDTVYLVEFLANVKNTTHPYMIVTDYGLLIVTSTSLANVVASMIPMTVVSLLLFPYGMIYLMFLSVLWWLRRSRERRMELQREVDELEREQALTEKKAGEAEFACTSCGAPVKEEDKICPKCGAKFEGEGEEKETPKEEEKETDKKKEKK